MSLQSIIDLSQTLALLLNAWVLLRLERDLGSLAAQTLPVVPRG